MPLRPAGHLNAIRSWIAAIATALAIGLAAPAAIAADNCPIGTEINVEQARKLKDALKRKLAHEGLPPRLQVLVDRLPDCPACIERASHVSIVTAVPRSTRERSGTSGVSTSAVGSIVFESRDWSPLNEVFARRALREGRATALHFTLLSGPCNCCPPDAAGAARWRQAGGIYRQSDRLFDNRTAISLQASSAGPDPKDLFELDPALTAEALDGKAEAPTSTLTAPPRLRVAQARCPTCRGAADTRNAAAERYNDLRDRYIAEYGEATRLKRHYASRSGESGRIALLVVTEGTDALKRDTDRYAEDGRILEQANAMFAKANATLDEIKALDAEIAKLDAALLACDEKPCTPPAVADATPAAAAPGARERFAFFLGLAAKQTNLSARVSPDFTTPVSGSDDPDHASVGAGLLAYPFPAFPIFVSAEGGLFVGSSGQLISVDLHPTAGNDTKATAEPRYFGRVTVGTTVPLQGGGCVTRSTCYLLDLEGGLSVERVAFTFRTDESGGGGVVNTVSFDRTQLGLSIGAAFSIPVCQLFHAACGFVVAPYARATWLRDASSAFQLTSAVNGFVYTGDLDIGRQVEFGLRLMFPFN